MLLCAGDHGSQVADDGGMAYRKKNVGDQRREQGANPTDNGKSDGRRLSPDKLSPCRPARLISPTSCTAHDDKQPNENTKRRPVDRFNHLFYVGFHPGRVQSRPSAPLQPELNESLRGQNRTNMKAPIIPAF